MSTTPKTHYLHQLDTLQFAQIVEAIQHSPQPFTLERVELVMDPKEGRQTTTQKLTGLAYDPYTTTVILGTEDTTITVDLLDAQRTHFLRVTEGPNYSSLRLSVKEEDKSLWFISAMLPGPEYIEVLNSMAFDVLGV